MASSSSSRGETARRILNPGRNVWKGTSAGETGVIVDAADYYLAFYEAARQARRTILLSGWQFDSGVPLLRGEDVPPGAEVRLLKFLDGLCEQNRELEIYILAWDFHVVFALEREWMQNLYFHWGTNARLHFRFDEAQPAQGSHHQKFAVIDRSLSFLGGIDLCEARWDDRRHRQHNPLRLSHGEPVKPYHDTQAYFAGCQVADLLRELFVDRWSRSEGRPLKLAECEAPEGAGGLGDPPRAPIKIDRPRGALTLGAAEVSFSRTDPRGPGETIREVEALFIDAIMAAERLIYIETQYFSSRAVGSALMKRMRQLGQARLNDQELPPLEIVVVLNQKPEAIKEEIAVGLRQAKVLTQLVAAARETGQALGIYDTFAEGEGPERPSTYIHSKLLIVDDRFLTIGSANLTNRSMGVDTELHASWETIAKAAGDDGDGDGDSDDADAQRLRAGITNLRVSLLAEHSGLLTDGADAAARLAEARGLVAHLDGLTRTAHARLHVHEIASPREKEFAELVDPEALPFDPGHPDYDRGAGADSDSDALSDEDDWKEEESQSRQLFIGGLTSLWRKLKPG